MRRGRLQGAGLRLSETAGQAHAGLPVDGRGRAGVQREVCPGAEDAPALQGVQVRPYGMTLRNGYLVHDTRTCSKYTGSRNILRTPYEAVYI